MEAQKRRIVWLPVSWRTLVHRLWYNSLCTFLRIYPEKPLIQGQSETSGCNHASSCLAFLLCQFFSWVGAILNLHPPPTPFGVSQDSPKGFRINFTSGSAISISSASGWSAGLQYTRKAPGSSAKAIIACKEYELTKYVMIVHTLLALSSWQC